MKSTKAEDTIQLDISARSLRIAASHGSPVVAVYIALEVWQAQATKAGHKRWFSVPKKALAECAGCSVSTVKRATSVLIKAKLITYRSGYGKMMANRYLVVPTANPEWAELGNM